MTLCGCLSNTVLCGYLSIVQCVAICPASCHVSIVSRWYSVAICAKQVLWLTVVKTSGWPLDQCVQHNIVLLSVHRAFLVHVYSTVLCAYLSNITLCVYLSTVHSVVMCPTWHSVVLCPKWHSAFIGAQCGYLFNIAL